MAESYSNPNPRRLRPASTHSARGPRPVADVLHPLETPSDASPPGEGPQGGPSSIAVAKALKRLARLKLPRTIYDRAKREIETEGIPAIEKWVPSDPLRALQELRENPIDGPKPCSQRKTSLASADGEAQGKPRSIPGGGTVDGTVVQLPVWPETMSACPSCVLRSALFGVVRRGWRKAVEGAEIAAWKGVTIRYTGWRLDQGDLDVWKAVLRLATNQALGEPLYFTESGLLRDTGRQYGKRNKEWLWSSLRRLKAC